MNCRCLDDDEPDDDRFDRWLIVNGIVSMGWQTLDDGKRVARYFRADGSEVDTNNQYGCDETFTPYTPTSGTA
jgi:hypothetical protein